MKSAIATVLLAGMLLNVGAFASDNRAYLQGKARQTNITVMTKNQAWPAPHPTTLESCVQGTCSDV